MLKWVCFLFGVCVEQKNINKMHYWLAACIVLARLLVLLLSLCSFHSVIVFWIGKCCKICMASNTCKKKKTNWADDKQIEIWGCCFIVQAVGGKWGHHGWGSLCLWFASRSAARCTSLLGWLNLERRSLRILIILPCQWLSWVAWVVGAHLRWVWRFWWGWFSQAPRTRFHRKHACC